MDIQSPLFKKPLAKSEVVNWIGARGDRVEGILYYPINFIEGKKYPKDPGLDRLVFFKTIAMKGFPGDPALEIYNSLKGVKGSEILGLKFFQMESLLEHKLLLGELKHIIFGDAQDMFTYATSYSLYELIEGVAWELSFNFNPLQCSLRG